MRLVFLKVCDPCCPNAVDVQVSEFTKGSLSMRDAVAANRRIAHLYLVPDDFDIANIELPTWDKTPAHAHAEPPVGLPGLTVVDVLLGDRIEDIAQMARPAKPEPSKKTAKRVKKGHQTARRLQGKTKSRRKK